MCNNFCSLQLPLVGNNYSLDDVYISYLVKTRFDSPQAFKWIMLYNDVPYIPTLSSQRTYFIVIVTRSSFTCTEMGSMTKTFYTRESLLVIYTIELKSYMLTNNWYHGSSTFNWAVLPYKYGYKLLYISDNPFSNIRWNSVFRNCWCRL